MLTNQKPNGQADGPDVLSVPPLSFLYSHQLLCLPQPSDLGFLGFLTFLIVMNDDHEDLLM